jgi:hypothetical protein
MEATIKKEFPDAKKIPDQINQIVEDYAKGKIPESLSEQADLQWKVAKGKKKNKNAQLPVADEKTLPVGSQRAHDTIVVSDVDDTIRIAQILGANTVIQYTTTEMPFTGLPDLYRTLGAEGAKFAYVSAIPKPLSGLTNSFLQKNQFPEGPLYARGVEGRAGHKETVIKQIIKENPGKKVILVGDNGESDSETFARLQKDPTIGHAIDSVYIHELFNRPGSAPLPEGQHAFLTAADFAVSLNQRGLISESDAQSQLSNLNQHLTVGDSDESARSTELRMHKAFPEFADVSPARIRQIIHPPGVSFPAGSEIEKGLATLENGIIEQRNRWGKLSCARNMIMRMTQATQGASH